MSSPTASSSPAASSIGVIGCGYLGAVHAACLAHWGFQVIGFDLSEEKVRMLSEGRAPFFEEDLDGLLKEGVRAGRLEFSRDLTRLTECSMVFLCVGTPQRADSPEADLSQLESAFASTLELLPPGSLVVGKSTVPVGTAAGLLERAVSRGLRLAWNPEFLREGTAVNDTLHPDRIVLGICDATAEVELREVYAQAITEGSAVVVTDLATAEIIKEAANAFLATKISFINAVSELCDASGADVEGVAHALGLDERIGSKFLKAGLGYGGGCFPKDVRALAHRSGELGARSLERLLLATDDANLSARRRALDLVRSAAGESQVAKIAVLGAAFKPGSDDLRDSPAVWLVQAVKRELPGVELSWHDPALSGRVLEGVELGESIDQVVRGADLVVLATDWPEYRELDPATLRPAGRVLLDLRNCVYAPRWVRSGWSVRFLGRPSRSPRH
jgi:UDPglucose 6-dehydrogenase